MPYGYYANKFVLSIDIEKLSKSGIKPEELYCYFPEYILHPISLTYGIIKYCLFKIIQLILRFGIRVFLLPRRGKVGKLDSAEVEAVYNREAKTYNRKHHWTTFGMDISWRRKMAFFAVEIVRKRKEPIYILDLCTGTGLTIKEIVKLLSLWKRQADIIGLDYNSQMLAIAEDSVLGNENINIRFVRGDVTNMVSGGQEYPGFTYFPPSSFDIITQMCGIGGVAEPLKVFEQVLRLLKKGGQFFMVDMHKPVPEILGEWPLLGVFCKMPVLEAVTYEQTTIPLALKRLWGWRDTTALFYLLPLVMYQDGEEYYGFEIVSRRYESLRWWFGLPVMPVGEIIVKKVKIDKEIFSKRRVILDACTIEN